MTLPDLGTVLCAVDLSDHSRAALFMAAGLTFDHPSRLVVLRVAPAGDDPRARDETSHFVTTALPRWPTGARVIGRAGEPAAQILAAAAEVDARLIVLGTRGLGALGRAVLGSTAGTLLRESPVPVAVVPPSHPEVIAMSEARAEVRLGVVLVAVELTPASERQLAWAAQLAGAADHRLLMLHVVRGADQQALAHQRMNAAARAVGATDRFRLLVRVGDPHEEVLHVAGLERDLGVVVLGRSSEKPGKLAYEILQQNRAVVVAVP